MDPQENESVCKIGRRNMEVNQDKPVVLMTEEEVLRAFQKNRTAKDDIIQAVLKRKRSDRYSEHIQTESD